MQLKSGGMNSYPGHTGLARPSQPVAGEQLAHLPQCGTRPSTPQKEGAGTLLGPILYTALHKWTD